MTIEGYILKSLSKDGKKNGFPSLSKEESAIRNKAGDFSSVQ